MRARFFEGFDMPAIGAVFCVIVPIMIVPIIFVTGIDRCLRYRFLNFTAR